MSAEEFHALWRSSAHEAVPYTDDFPEALLVLPELFDGSTGQGNATKITVTFILNKENSRLIVSDNGGGIKNERRLLQWAAVKATDNIHRNGHGTKKCLTKWEPDYAKAKWSIKWRNARKNLQVTKGPFIGKDTVVEEIEGDETLLMPSGCEISIEFSAESVLHALGTKPADLFKAIKEIIQTRYSEETLLKTEFVIEITDSESGARSISKSSRKEKWHSFKKCVEDSVVSGIVAKLHESRHPFAGGHYTFEVFYITPNGTTTFAIKKEFPKFGLKSMKSSRAHTSLDGRMIEAIPIYQLMNREANHNDYNGYIVFVNFVPDTKEDFDKMPVPCTTKVSLYENNAVFKQFKANFTTVFGPVHRRNLNHPVPPPVPTPPTQTALPFAITRPVAAPIPEPEPPVATVAPVPEPAAPRVPDPMPELEPEPTPLPTARAVMLPPLDTTPKVYQEFLEAIHPIVKAVNPRFTPQEIVSEVAKLWNMRKVLLTPVPAPIPPPAPVVPTTPAEPIPPPPPTHSFRIVNGDDNTAIILEDDREIHQIPTAGQFHHWRECIIAVLNKYGPQRFREWLSALSATNNLLRA